MLPRFCQTNDVYEYTTHFQPFSRYKPFYFEVDLDAAVIKEYFKQKPFTGQTASNWHQSLNTQYVMSSASDEGPYVDSEEDIPLTKPKKKDASNPNQMSFESDHDSGGDLDEDLVKQGTR